MNPALEMRWFVLNEDHSLAEVTIEEFAKHRSTEDERKIMARDVLPGGVVVVTAFFGMDHRHMAAYTCPMDGVDSDSLPVDLPIVFGTMTFGGSTDGNERMWSTYEKAMAGHQRALTEARIGSIVPE